MQDELFARFVVGSHLRSHPKFESEKDEMDVGTSLDAEVIPQDLLRKYIMHAREKIRPKLHDLDREKISRLFVHLVRESLATGSVPITVRHPESVIRMSAASAKMALREYVRGDDVDLAIRVTVRSFVSAQKTSIKKILEWARDHEELLAWLLGQLIKEKAWMYQYQRYEQPEVVVVKVAEVLDERVLIAIVY